MNGKIEIPEEYVSKNEDGEEVVDVLRWYSDGMTEYKARLADEYLRKGDLDGFLLVTGL